MRAFKTLSITGLLFCVLSTFAQEGLIPFRSLDKYGWLDLKGKVKVPARFDRTFPFKEGLGRFTVNGMYGYARPDGKVVIPAIYKQGFDFNEGLARVKEGPVWAFIDPYGRKVFTVAAEDVHDFYNGMAVIKRKGFYGYINNKGEEIIPAIMTQPDRFENGVARMKVGKYYGLVDRKGELRLQLIHDYIGTPTDSFLRVKTNGRWFVYSIQGKKICSSPELIVGEFSNGLAPVRVLDPSMVFWFNYMGPEGDIVIENNFEQGAIFQDNVAVVKYEGQFGVINREGKWMAEPSYVQTKGIYSEGMLGVRVGDQWGYIDTRGNQVIPTKYFDVQPFEKGLAMVAKGPRKWGVIDKKGNLLVPMLYDVVVQGSYYFMAIKGYYRSYYTKSGELIWADKPDEE